MQTFGYMRVSMKKQNEAQRLCDFRQLHIDERDIFIDKQIGNDFDSSQYQLLKSSLNKGDLLYIHSIELLGRNYKQIKEEWREITKVIGADIKVLDMPILDTTQYKDLIGSFVSDFILEMLGFVAEKEVEMIKSRQRQGIDSALANGVRFGRKPINLSTLTPEQKKTLEQNWEQWKDGKITGVTFAKNLGLKKTTFYKIIKQYEQQQLQKAGNT